MKKYLVAALLCLPFLLTGCLNFENIELVAVKDVTYREFKDNILHLDVTMTVNNPNKIRVNVSKASMNLMFGEQILGTLTQMEQIELPGQTRKDYKVRVAIELKDMAENMIALFRILMNESDKLSLSGTVQAKAFLYSKEIQIKKLSFR